jgi:hypothetical protein
MLPLIRSLRTVYRETVRNRANFCNHTTRCNRQDKLDAWGELSTVPERSRASEPRPRVHQHRNAMAGVINPEFPFRRVSVCAYVTQNTAQQLLAFWRVHFRITFWPYSVTPYQSNAILVHISQNGPTLYLKDHTHFQIYFTKINFLWRAYIVFINL